MYTHKRLALYIVLVLDAAWWTAWFGVMVWLMVDPAVVAAARLAIILSAMHVGLASALLGAWDKATNHERVPRMALFWAAFAMGVDLFSVLDAFLHLPHVEGALPNVVAACQGLALSSMIISALGVVAYIVLIVTERRVRN